nr:retrotransposon protein, putative, Ty1-copia subclass [Tanacetum cinerariifolium]
MAESFSAPKRSERDRKERNSDLDFFDSQAIIFLVQGDNENNVINNIPILLNVDDASKTYKEAITSRNSAFWKEATDDEIDSLVSNNTWDLSDLPPGSEAIGCRWVYRIKYHTDRFIQNFKARLTKDYGVILCLHVDDILIVKTNMKCINETKKFLSSCFQMKDMNGVDIILGIKEANTSYESSCKLVENNGRDVAQIEYASAICCLMIIGKQLEEFLVILKELDD